MSNKLSAEYLEILAAVEVFESWNWLSDDEIQNLVREVLSLRARVLESKSDVATTINVRTREHWTEK
jgi:hypothetical protein